MNGTTMPYRSLLYANICTVTTMKGSINGLETAFGDLRRCQRIAIFLAPVISTVHWWLHGGIATDMSSGPPEQGGVGTHGREATQDVWAEPGSS